MPFAFRKMRYRSEGLSIEADLAFCDGMIVGLVGPDGAGKKTLLQLASGILQPDSGAIELPGEVYLAEASLASADPRQVRLSLEDPASESARVVLIGPSLALTDTAFQQSVLSRLHRSQARGTVILFASHDLALLERHADEVVVLEAGKVVERGDPGLVLRAYRRRVLSAECAASGPVEMQPSSQHGDQRGSIEQVEVLDTEGRSVSTIQSGSETTVRVVVRYGTAVAEPVVGLLIRSQVGVNVYGTNTELERLSFGPVAAGDKIEVQYRFAAVLCPGEYTLTVASHDPDGTAHEWLEDAIRFTVGDSRYTAGVANLRAKVEARRLS
ncbi:MAG: Wzt carbohydrate-binding domain-containing protein [Bryobacterales bacterium]